MLRAGMTMALKAGKIIPGPRWAHWQRRAATSVIMLVILSLVSSALHNCRPSGGEGEKHNSEKYNHNNEKHRGGKHRHSSKRGGSRRRRNKKRRS